MIITKHLEEEIKQFLDNFWKVYLEGDLQTWSTYLTDDYKNIGTTQQEIWNSKQEIMNYTESVIGQMAGYASLRNKSTQVFPLGPFILAHEFGDMYIKMENEWVFYSKLRLSSIIQKTEEGWQVIHQHGSYPDSKTDQGEAFAFDKISTENRDLKDAIKRRTAELENKTRELEIEAALEKVRTAAMAMNEPGDMVEVCRIISDQLQTLGVHDIRNVQTAIINESKGTYLNYQYFTAYAKGIVEDTEYNKHPKVFEMVQAMRSSADAFFGGTMENEELQTFREWRKQNNQFPDPLLDETTAFHYNFYSIGLGGLGLTTYKPLPQTGLEIFKRFHNVFTLAYRRFIDIELAFAQAKEAKTEAALEKVRAVAMSMNKPEDLLNICEVVFREFQKLGFSEIRNAMINIHNDAKKTFLNYDFSDEIGKSITPLFYNIHPVIEKQIKQIRSANDAFSETVFKGKELESWKEFRKNKGEKDDPRINEISALYYYFYSIGTGSIGISTFSSMNEEKLDLLKRFRNVFSLSYQRYSDIALAEAQAREAQIEMCLERVRARAMAMQNSIELVDTSTVLFHQLKTLGIESIRTGISTMDEDNETIEIWSTSGMSENFKKKIRGIVPAHVHPMFSGFFNSWKNKEPYFAYELKGSELIKYYKSLSSYLSYPAQKVYNEREMIYAFFFPEGSLNVVAHNNLSEDECNVLVRFAKVFGLVYTRFLDLKQAEAQAREAQIESALEKIRSSALAMQTSQQLKDVASELRNQMRLLGQEDLEVCAINLYDVDENYFESWGAIRTREGNEKLFEGNARFPKSGVKIVDEMMEHYKRGTRDYVLVNEKEKAKEWIAVLKEYSPEAYEMIRETIAIQKTEDLRVYWSLADFDGGAMLMVTYSEPDDSLRDLLRRTANVFELAYRRFQDLQTAEAHTEKAKLDLIQIQTEKKRAEEALAELQATQKQLIHAEKMASLGELTAGIAHEIQNPLNFVNNFSEVSRELVKEMNDELAIGTEASVQLAKEISEDIEKNLEKINHHGKRADAIVKGMLQHSRTNTGQKELTDINVLADEYLRLAYHGLRAKDKSFNADFKTELDASLPKIKVIPQDMGRVLLNLINNAFYAVSDRAKLNENGYKPEVTIITQNLADKIEITVKDNGNGIPPDAKDKIFQPFFTTKPTGQGTGLGLSLSYDIVKAHGGELTVETKEGDGAVFIIRLPL